MIYVLYRHFMCKILHFPHPIGTTTVAPLNYLFHLISSDCRVPVITRFWYLTWYYLITWYHHKKKIYHQYFACMPSVTTFTTKFWWNNHIFSKEQSMQYNIFCSNFYGNINYCKISTQHILVVVFSVLKNWIHLACLNVSKHFNLFTIIKVHSHGSMAY